MRKVEPSKEEMLALRAGASLEAWRSVLMTYKMLFNILDSQLQKAGCTIPRLQVYFVLYFEGPQKPVNLAKRLMVTRGNMSTLLKRMINEGLVGPSYEVGSENRPGYQLTEKGRAEFLRLFPIHANNIENEVPVLSEATMQELYESQLKIHDKHGLGAPVKPKKSGKND